ncbi:MAG: hypothetical protein P8I99_01080 [Acidimicrobiales bacterium]|nr:hypothetical protein [Acidimicrobiales bacterium]
MLDPALPDQLDQETTGMKSGHDLPNWDMIMADLTSGDNAPVVGAKVPTMVGRTGFEPVTSAV